MSFNSESIKVKNAKMKSICVKNLKTCGIEVVKSIHLPVLNVGQTDPSTSDLAVDKNTGNLYYSDGNDWYLTQPTRKDVNAVINPQGTGDFKSLNSFFDLFQGSPTGYGTANVTLQPGSYVLDRSDILLRINQLNIVGDARNISGMSYVNGKRANMNNQPLLGTSGSNTELLFDNDTVTINVNELDLTKVSLVPGDQVYIFSAITSAPGIGPALETYVIKTIEINKIVLTTKLSEKILTAYADGALSPSITFCPNRIVTLSDDFIYNISLNIKGIWFKTKSIIFNEIFVGTNSLVNSRLISNKNLQLTNTTQISVSNYGFFGKINVKIEGVYIIAEGIGAIRAIDSDIIINNSTFLVYQFDTNSGGKGILHFQNCKSPNFNSKSSGIDQAYIPVKGGFSPDQTTGPLFYLEKLSSVSQVPVVPVADIFFDNVKCENVTTLAYVLNSRISVSNINLKFNVELAGFFIPVLWYAKNSYIGITNDTYTFDKFGFDIYEALNGGIINIFEGNYINNPPGHNFTYKADGNGSQINANILRENRWPGTIIETNDGTVLFQPIADFSFTPLTGPAPLQVTFTAVSTESAYLYFWDFGDGSRIIKKNPVHTYQSSGNYNIKLFVEGNVPTKSQTVTKPITIL